MGGMFYLDTSYLGKIGGCNSKDVHTKLREWLWLCIKSIFDRIYQYFCAHMRGVIVVEE
jgi:hypothetical protein